MYSTSDPDICRTSDGLPRVMWGTKSRILKPTKHQMNKVNTQFQSESPQLHLLKGAIEGLMQSFATNFMNPRYVISREVSKIDMWLTLEYRFPVLGKKINTSKDELEWRSYIHLEPEFFGCANDGSARLLDAESYWGRIEMQKSKW
ncbi:hypothetical protein OUZ56_026148 [Daphnia magna]|uniref:Uncharacterized protein n=1 Tax=Daphnia magna TaxID=35525 RepID=A0ABQ9ZKW7_9CRUS|nr:hypothetical protein OUZ56_026148 [Daphnia magna]